MFASCWWSESLVIGIGYDFKREWELHIAKEYTPIRKLNPGERAVEGTLKAIRSWTKCRNLLGLSKIN